MNSEPKLSWKEVQDMVDTILLERSKFKQGLQEPESLVLEASYFDKKYREVSKGCYTDEYLNSTVAPRFFKVLTDALELDENKKVNKKNCIEYLLRKKDFLQNPKWQAKQNSRVDPDAAPIKGICECRAIVVFKGKLTADNKVVYDRENIELRDIVAHLRNKYGLQEDSTIYSIEQDEVRITCSGLSINMKKLKELVRAGELENIYKIPIEDIQISNKILVGKSDKHNLVQKIREQKVADQQLVSVNLSEMNLSNCFLYGARLSYTDLSRAELSNAALIEADLSYADLYKVIFKKANLTKAKLCEADLRRATFEEANLTEADLYKTKLHEAILKRANLTEAKLCHAILVSADLEEASLYKTDMHKVDMHKANLARAQLSETILSGSNLQEANLEEANLYKTDMNKAVLCKAKLIGAVLTDVEVQGADLREANLKDSTLTRIITDNRTKLSNEVHQPSKSLEQKEDTDPPSGTNCIGVNLREANLSDSNIIDSNLSHADFSRANLSGATVTNNDFSHADFSRANLSRATVRNVNFSLADFSGANLSGATVRNNNFSGATLLRAHVQSAKFRGNKGLSEDMIYSLEQRGAIFESNPVIRFARSEPIVFFGIICPFIGLAIIHLHLLPQLLLYVGGNVLFKLLFGGLFTGGVISYLYYLARRT